ncbi:MAG: M61 family peptidase, partial [Colwellia sp.]
AGKVSYRDVHKALYNNHKLPAGFDEKDVLSILQNLTGLDYSNWWEGHVDSPANIDFDELLNKVGLIFERPKGAEAIASIDAVAKNTGQLLTLTHVQRGGSAWKAGLTTNDKIVAINKLHVNKDLKSSLETFKPGDKVVIDFIRRDALQSLTLVLTEKFDKPKKVTANLQASEKQKALFKAWMGVEHPNDTK